MDKTIEVVLVATVALIVASIAIFMARGQAEEFSGFLGSESSDAKCDLWREQFKDSCGESKKSKFGSDSVCGPKPSLPTRCFSDVEEGSGTEGDLSVEGGG